MVICKPKMGKKSVEEKHADSIESSSPTTDSNRQQLSKELITPEQSHGVPQSGMLPINVEILMGHSVGIGDSC